MKTGICHITTVHPVMDDRILYKECISLQESGYEVSIVACNPDNVTIQGINILKLPDFTSRRQRFFSGNWLAYKLALQSGAAIMHFHDPELMLMGVALRLAGKKVIYDVHENLVQQVRYKPWIKPAFLRWILSVIIFLAERFSCLFYQGIIAATDDIATKFPARKTRVIRNFSILKWSQDIHYEKVENEVPQVVYAGGLTRIRGIKEIIQALEFIHSPLELKLIGKFDDEDYELECKSLKGWTKVRYKGFMPLREVYHEIAVSDVGIAMLYPIRNYLSSLPVKAFEYMTFGLPMLLSDFPYWKEMFDGCAVFADPYRPEAIANGLTKLLTDKNLRDTLGNYGKHRIQQELNWETESRRLLDLYKKITHEG